MSNFPIYEIKMYSNLNLFFNKIHGDCVEVERLIQSYGKERKNYLFS